MTYSKQSEPFIKTRLQTSLRTLSQHAPDALQRHALIWCDLLPRSSSFFMLQFLTNPGPYRHDDSYNYTKSQKSDENPFPEDLMCRFMGAFRRSARNLPSERYTCSVDKHVVSVMINKIHNYTCNATPYSQKTGLEVLEKIFIHRWNERVEKLKSADISSTKMSWNSFFKGNPAR